MNWEKIDDFHFRTKVFGGWLVKVYEHVEHASITPHGFWERIQSQEMNVSMCFVPDLNWKWQLKESK